jgi:hypothetical protein
MMWIDIGNIAAIETFLLSIPESAGLLIFGVTLVAVPVLIRWLLDRGNDNESDEGLEKKV